MRKKTFAVMQKSFLQISESCVIMCRVLKKEDINDEGKSEKISQIL